MYPSSLDQLKTRIQELSERSSELEERRKQCRIGLDKRRAQLRAFNGQSTPKQTLFGSLFCGGKAAELLEVNREISELTMRIAGLDQSIESCAHDIEREIDNYLVAQDDHYRKESMRWKAVMYLKHASELYHRETERALKMIHDLREDEHVRADSGVRSRDWNEIVSHAFYEQAHQTIKDAYERFGSAVEDMRQHDKKVSCKITITYHGGTMTFDIYEHPEHLSLYRIDTLEQCIEQLEGLRNAIKTVIVHAEGQYRFTIAERIKYHNRVRKSL